MTKVYSHLNEGWVELTDGRMEQICEAHYAPDWKLEHVLWYSGRPGRREKLAENRHAARRLYLSTPALRTLYELLLTGI